MPDTSLLPSISTALPVTPSSTPSIIAPTATTKNHYHHKHQYSVFAGYRQRPTLSDKLIRPASPAPSSFQGMFLRYERQAGSKGWQGGGGSSSLAISIAMTAAQFRTKERHRKKAPASQQLLGPAIPAINPFEGKTRLDDADTYGAAGAAAKTAQALLKVPSTYHHSSLDATMVLQDYQTASADIHFCPTTRQQGEGKSFSYLRAVKKITPTEQIDTRRDAGGYWHFKKRTCYPRKEIIRDTFWSPSSVHLHI